VHINEAALSYSLRNRRASPKFMLRPFKYILKKEIFRYTILHSIRLLEISNNRRKHVFYYKIKNYEQLNK